MTLNQLNQLRWLPGEIELISRHLEELPDTPDIPEDIERRERLVSWLDRCRKEYAEGMAYLDAAPDPYIRQLLTYRFVNGFSWKKIAGIVRGATPQSVKMQCLRYIEKHPDLPEKA